MLSRKYPEPQKGKKTRRLENNLETLNTEKLISKPVIWKNYWVLNASELEPSNWIVHQSVIFEYNPFTYTILKYCSTDDTEQVKNPENPED